MYRNKEKKLAEIMLGEAVLKLLHEGGSLGAASLTKMLSMMKKDEPDELRRQACTDAISHIRASLSQSGAVEESGNIFHFLAATGTSDDKKKH